MICAGVQMEIGCHILGPPGVPDGRGGVRALAGRRAMALALLAVNHREIVTIDALVDAVWPDADAPPSGAAVRMLISRVRAELVNGSGDDPIASEPNGYRLDLDAAEVDADAFSAGLSAAHEAARRDDPARALASVREALALWRGEPFGPFATNTAFVVVSGNLTARRHDAEELEVDALLALGRSREALPLATALVDRQPLRERRWAQLMLAQYRCGDQADALRSFDRARRTLVDELGIEPNPELRRLELAILEQSEDLLVASLGGERRATAASSSLLGVLTRPRRGVPRADSSFVGRDAERAKVTELLDRHRLVTIVGPAGVGKTRLAQEVARSRGDEVIYTALAPYAPGEVTDALADALDLRADSDPSLPEALIKHLAQRVDLLVLDNAEHLLDDIAPLAQALVEWCPNLRILVTSRSALGCPSEHRVALGPLDGASAGRLLVDRAHQAGITVDEGVHLDQLLQRLDHLPLAIELAAAQLTTMTIPELSQSLDRSIADLRRSSTAEERHRSATAAIGWSYDLLSPVDRQVLTALGVMPGPFRAVDAASVAGTSDAVARASLSRLGDMSIVAVSPGARSTSFRLLEVTRAFAHQRLVDSGALADVLDRHARHYAGVASQVSSGLRGSDEAGWVADAEAATEQFRTALRHLVDRGDPEAAAAMAIDLWDWAFMRLHFGFFRTADDVLALPGVESTSRHDELLGTAAIFAWMDSRVVDAHRHGMAAVAAAEAAGRPSPHSALAALTNSAGFLGQAEEGARWAARLLRRTAEMGDPYWHTNSNVIATIGMTLLGAPEEAGRYADDAAEAAVRSHNPSTIAWARFGQGYARLETDPAAAMPFLRESSEIARDVTNRWVGGQALAGIVVADRRLGRLDEAGVLLADLLDLWTRGRMLAQVAHALREAALLLSSRGGDPDLVRESLVVATAMPAPHPTLPSDLRLLEDAERRSRVPTRRRDDDLDGPPGGLVDALVEALRGVR